MQVKGRNSNSVEAKNQWRYNNMHACVCVCVCVCPRAKEWKLFKLIARGTLFPVYMNVRGTRYFKQAVIWAVLWDPLTQKKKGNNKIGKIITRNKAIISLMHFVLQRTETKVYSILQKYYLFLYIITRATTNTQLRGNIASYCTSQICSGKKTLQT